MGPKIDAFRKLISADITRDTRKLYATDKFKTDVFGDSDEAPSASTIKGFIERRRAFLLAHPEIKALKDER